MADVRQNKQFSSIVLCPPSEPHRASKMAAVAQSDETTVVKMAAPNVVVETKSCCKCKLPKYCVQWCGWALFSCNTFGQLPSSSLEIVIAFCCSHWPNFSLHSHPFSPSFLGRQTFILTQKNIRVQFRNKGATAVGHSLVVKITVFFWTDVSLLPCSHSPAPLPSPPSLFSYPGTTARRCSLHHLALDHGHRCEREQQK